MSARVLSCVFVGVMIVLLGSATAASASWIYTQNWAPAANNSNEIPASIQNATGNQIATMPDYPSLYYYVNDTDSSGTLTSDGFTASVANNILSYNEPLGAPAYTRIAAYAGSVLAAATPTQTGSAFDLSKGAVTLTARVEVNGNGNNGYLMIEPGMVWAGQTDVLMISPDTSFVYFNAPSGATKTGSFTGLPTTLDNVWLKVTGTLSQQSPSSYQVVWSLSSADGSTSYGSQTATQSTAPALSGFDFALASGADIDAELGAFSIQQTSVPEPSALILSAMGLTGLLAYAWRKRR